MNNVKLRENQEVIKGFWERFDALIKQCGITKIELSTRLNPKDPSPRKLQNMYDKRLPDAEEVVIIAKALNTTVEYLVTGEDNTGLSEDSIKAAKIYETIHPMMKQKAMEMLEVLSEFKNPYLVDPNDIPSDYHPDDSEAT